ncbi:MULTISPECIES: Fe-S-containing hydro-lyase [Clostridium]|uniref:Fe-S-containing hydro-lyase n=1 Tax=Clostridium cadaveris TaxID=1529 RepID=A0A1I2L2R6_9CLOT|nr:Fe-S-containing hydro-lyase [Clostridium cadaveris]MDU4951574.1 Fe-S-containing hydro-lyase [Clostridium sp.]MDM8312453.1 Fe-S-containing hydro-lyase [Clostridium cadaveris]MDY4949955.1 Fe-S-containing hydro-lyase [Clostridium cadaveris]NME63591.1 Fe-S-containing hydro-lyase [Clostridium cadaveris]NWK09865.1 Fe-S-containing hydro-lyase [Clostridium cadaveris]
MEKRITTPLTLEKVKDLKAGDTVLISGTIYTSRDAGHKRFVDLLDKGESLPFDPKDQIIYYVGPTPTKPGHAFGSAGPTSSYRMDPYAPRLLEVGLRGMIGKGLRNEAVIESIKKNGGVYFAAIGGAAALIGKAVKKAEIIAYEDLGAEALRELQVEDLPVIVVIDSEGNNLYEQGQKEYLDSVK